MSADDILLLVVIVSIHQLLVGGILPALTLFVRALGNSPSSYAYSVKSTANDQL